MPREKDFKRRVRRRMRDKGERYLVARQGVRSEVMHDTWTRVEPAAPHRGRRLRLRAAVAGQDVVAHAYLWMRVNGPDGQELSSYSTVRPSLRGTFDPIPLEIVLDVDRAADTVRYGVSLLGPGRIQTTDVRIDQVPESVLAMRCLPVDDWQAGGNSHSYQLSREPAITPSGVDDVVVLWSGGPADTIRSMSRSVSAERYRGRRLRLRGLLSTEGVVGSAGLWMRVDGLEWERLAHDDMEDRALTGTTDWMPATVVLDVPAAASRIYYGVLLRGSGAVRSTAIEFGPVDSSVPVTRRFAVPAWALSGSGADACEVRVEPGEPPAGRRVCAISSTGDLAGRAVTLAQFVTTPSYRSGTVRLRATLQGEDLASARLVVRCLDPYDLDLREPARSAALSGTFDWRRASVEQPVDWRAASIVLGVEVAGRGVLRVGDVRLDVVRTDTAADWREPPQLRNLDFTDSPGPTGG
jgi:hypothetical protein